MLPKGWIHPERVEAFNRRYNCVGMPPGLWSHISIKYNCAGEPIKLWGGAGWKAHWYVLYPGAAWAAGKYFAATGTDRVTEGGFIDVRGLALLKVQCCPEIINSLLLGAEEMPD